MQPFRTSFERVLTSEDSKRNIPFRFEIPSGITELQVELDFSPWSVEGINNLITLTLFDPTGFRGAGHRHGHHHLVTVNAATATVGYFPGPIQQGEWTVEVDTHIVMPGPPCAMRLQVTATDAAPQEAAVIYRPGKTAPRGPGWYRGDLHAHTHHSDAAWDANGLVAWARENRLDFATLTDHNTVSGLPQMDSLSANDLLTMGGMELTTFHGHALALGLRQWVDWRTSDGGRTMARVAQEVMDKGGTFIIAHPKEVGDPYCTGCDWLHADMQPGVARVVEVWNTNWESDSHNEQGLALVFDWLNRGYRLALTAGTDGHNNRKNAYYGFNVVWADELSEEAILRAVRAGHLYISHGPGLDWKAVSSGGQAMMGDMLAVRDDDEVALRAEWQNAPAGSQIAWIVDGQTKETIPAPEQGTVEWRIRDQAKWSLITLRDSAGEMLALTNPIFFTRD